MAGEGNFLIEENYNTKAQAPVTRKGNVWNILLFAVHCFFSDLNFENESISYLRVRK